MDLQRYAYISEQNDQFDADSLQLLVNEAAALNSLDGITGIMFVVGNSFVQIVEGGHSAIADLRKRLECDPRHKNMQTLLDENAQDRLFLGWDMRLLDHGFHNANKISYLIRPRTLPTHISAIIDNRTEYRGLS